MTPCVEREYIEFEEDDMRITITEALAEVKTIGKRMEKKREAIREYLGRDVRLRDPMESSGGSREYIRRERQALRDLGTRLLNLRQAIQETNLSTELSINGTTRRLASWLNWRRELAEAEGVYLRLLNMSIKSVREKIQKEGRSVVSSEADAGKEDVIINLDEAALHEEIEAHETLVGTLDGKLSYLNATTVIEIPD